MSLVRKPLNDSLSAIPSEFKILFIHSDHADLGNVWVPLHKAHHAGAMTPPTKVQNFVIFEFLRKKGEVDAIDDTDLSWLDDDSFDECTQNLSTCIPVRVFDVVADRRSEGLEARQCLP